uniref:Uncharacterized protein n=1 Tax=Ciona intestinalis TaxID=7719 RepID=H2XRB4_CIOIN
MSNSYLRRGATIWFVMLCLKLTIVLMFMYLPIPKAISFQWYSEQRSSAPLSTASSDYNSRQNTTGMSFNQRFKSKTSYV